MRNLIYTLILLLQSFVIVVCDDEVQFQIVKNQCYLGDEISFAIIIESENNITEDFSKIVYNGKEIVVNKKTSTNSSVNIINGKMYSKQSTRNVYIFSFNPTAEGQFELISMPYILNGVTRQTQSFNYTVKALPFDPNFSFIINLKNKRDFYYPSEIIEGEIVFGLKSYTGIVNQLPILSGIDLMDNPGLQFIVDENSTHKMMINNREYPIQLSNKTETVDTSNFQTYMSIPFKFRAISPGNYKLDNCVAKAQVTTGKLTRETDFWGQRQKEVINVYGKAKGFQFEIKSLPDKNKPEDFNGALGSFDIETVSSADSGFKVGDPVTLHIIITGTGDWENIKAPALHKLTEITDFFRVANETPAGVVSEDGKKKEFNVKLRVKSATVKEIPAIPFSYFDINKAQYVTKYSKPIPIKVFENSNKVEVITFQNEENQKPNVDDERNNKNEIKSSQKIENLKPIEVMTVFKGDCLKINQDTGNMFLNLSFLNIFILVFIVTIRLLMKSSLINKVQADSQLKNSNKKCIEKLASLQKRLSEGEVIYRLITETIDEFFHLKYGYKINTVSKESIEGLVKFKDISENTGKDLLDLIDKLEFMKFSRSKFDANATHELIEYFKKIIAGC